MYRPIDLEVARREMASFNTLNDIRSEMNLILEKVSSDNFLSVIQSTLSEFEYQGLNVIGFLQEIYRRGRAAGKLKDAIQSDISSMVLLFLSRGNNVDKMLLRTNDVGRARISGLKTIYKLANNVGLRKINY